MLQSTVNRRKAKRRARDHDAWLTIDGDICRFDCRVLDISADGAKVLADLDAPIGAIIHLSAVPHAIARKLAR